MAAATAAAAVTIGVVALTAVGPPLERWALGIDGVPRVAIVVDLSAEDGTGAGTWADLEAAWRRRLAPREVRVHLAPGPVDAAGLAVEVVVLGADAAEAPALARELTVGGVLELRAVVADTPEARALYEAARRTGVADAAIDTWRDADDAPRIDYYLEAPSRAAIVAAVATLQAAEPGTRPAAGRTIAYEQRPSRDGTPASVRSYVLGETYLTSTDVASAQVIWDDPSMRPQVELTFTSDGGRRFGDVTAAHVGDKLAIVVDGAVTSAPVILSRIPGGRAVISMGTGSPDAQQADAAALAAALARPVALPPGLHARDIRAIGPSPGPRWALRLSLAA
ncbi:MAG: hypothetical protein H6709_25190, partial [Kofleriaceae bacterium]|nr:hypothetical protein [Kofleriaceae bacterium]MCB9575385.1 hypothetical protein [Kofleriaceae bacterium]